MTATDYLNQFDKAMTPQPGFNEPRQHQIDAGVAYALAALAAAVLETGTTPDLNGITLKTATHHSI